MATLVAWNLASQQVHGAQVSFGDSCSGWWPVITCANPFSYQTVLGEVVLQDHPHLPLVKRCLRVTLFSWNNTLEDVMVQEELNEGFYLKLEVIDVAQSDGNLVEISLDYRYTDWEKNDWYAALDGNGQPVVLRNDGEPQWAKGILTLDGGMFTFTLDIWNIWRNNYGISMNFAVSVDQYPTKTFEFPTDRSDGLPANDYFLVSWLAMQSNI